MPITPETFAKECGFSPRRVRQLARELGACRILGNRMSLEPEDVRALLEALKPCPSPSSAAARSGTTAAPSTDIGGITWHYSTSSRQTRKAHGRRSREWKRHFDGPAAVTTFAQAAILYRGAGKATRFLDQVEDHWRDTPIREITPGAIRQAAIDLYPGAIRGNAQSRSDHRDGSSHQPRGGERAMQRIRVKRFPTEKTRKTPTSWTWVAAFMSASHPRLGALACFMFLTGARISEACSLRWTDLNIAGGTALIRQTKTGEERRAHLPAILVAALANIPGPREGRVFGYSSRQSCDDLTLTDRLVDAPTLPRKKGRHERD